MRILKRFLTNSLDLADFIISSVFEFPRISYKSWKISSTLFRNTPKPYDNTLNSYTIKKIKAGAVLIPFIYGLQFSKLASVELNENNLKLIVLLSTTLAPYDDLFDSNTQVIEKIPKNINTLMDENSKSSSVKFLKNALNELYDLLDETGKSNFINYLDKMHEAQVMSLEQKKNDIDITKLEQITKEKGGNFILLMSSIFQNLVDQKSISALYSFGSLVQLTDDVSDCAKDHEEGIKTLATEQKNYSEMLELIQKYRNDFLDKFNISEYSKTKRITFIFRMSLVLELWLEIYHRLVELRIIGVQNIFIKITFITLFCLIRLLVFLFSFDSKQN